MAQIGTTLESYQLFLENLQQNGVLGYTGTITIPQEPLLQKGETITVPLPSSCITCGEDVTSSNNMCCKELLQRHVGSYRKYGQYSTAGIHLRMERPRIVIQVGPLSEAHGRLMHPNDGQFAVTRIVNNVRSVFCVKVEMASPRYPENEILGGGATIHCGKNMGTAVINQLVMRADSVYVVTFQREQGRIFQGAYRVDAEASKGPRFVLRRLHTNPCVLDPHGFDLDMPRMFGQPHTYPADMTNLEKETYRGLLVCNNSLKAYRPYVEWRPLPDTSSMDWNILLSIVENTGHYHWAYAAILYWKKYRNTSLGEKKEWAILLRGCMSCGTRRAHTGS